jgi:hypothetical protein
MTTPLRTVFPGGSEGSLDSSRNILAQHFGSPQHSHDRDNLHIAGTQPSRSRLRRFSESPNPHTTLRIEIEFLARHDMES